MMTWVSRQIEQVEEFEFDGKTDGEKCSYYHNQIYVN